MIVPPPGSTVGSAGLDSAAPALAAAGSTPTPAAAPAAASPVGTADREPGATPSDFAVLTMPAGYFDDDAATHHTAPDIDAVVQFLGARHV